MITTLRERRVARLWTALFFLSPVVPLLLYFHRNWYTIFHSWSLAMVAGILAFGYIMNQFILAARPRYFDRIFGNDVLIRFHGNMGVVTALLLVAHIALKNVYQFERNLQVMLGVVAAQIFLLVIVVSVLFFATTFVMRLKVLQRFREFSTKRLPLQYQHLRVFHNLTIVAAALAAGHVVLASSTAETPVRQGVMAVWFLVALVMYVDHRIVRPWRLHRRRFTVTSLVEEAPGIWTIRLAPPAGVTWYHQAGQFAYVRLPIGPEEHPYTLSSPEGDAPAFTAKDLGDWSGRLGSVKPGDPVAVDGPYGRFTIPHGDLPGRVVMFAGGIGITPFLAMIRTLHRRQSAATVHLIWNVRYREELFCEEELNAIAGDLDGFSWEPLCSREEGGERMSGAWLAGRRREIVGSDPAHGETDFFLCGPAGQIESLVSTLKQWHVSPRHIHFESFAM